MNPCQMCSKTGETVSTHDNACTEDPTIIVDDLKVLASEEGNLINNYEWMDSTGDGYTIWDIGGIECSQKLPIIGDLPDDEEQMGGSQIADTQSCEHSSDEMEVDEEGPEPTSGQKGKVEDSRGDPEMEPSSICPSLAIQQGAQSAKLDGGAMAKAITTTQSRKEKERKTTPDDDDASELSEPPQSHEIPRGKPHNVYCEGEDKYWIGVSTLVLQFWRTISLHIRIGDWQQALFVLAEHFRQILPCKACAKSNEPCFIYLNVTPGCIWCLTLAGRRSCSFVATFEGGHVHKPYSNVIGKYFHTMLIAYFMDGYQLLLFPQNFEGVNFYPRIQRGVNTNGGLKPKQIAMKRSEALKRWKKIKKGAWTDLWYGVPYAEAREAYADHVSRNDKTWVQFKGSVWQITDLPNVHQLRLVSRYYKLLDAIQAKSNWTSFDMLAHVLLVPTILEIPPPRKQQVQNPPPQKRGMSCAQWLKHLEDGGDEKYEAIEGYEDEDKDLPAAESEDEAAQDDGHSKPERK
ncbi:hypothetical protein QCA50_010867 [Cerrena zonata]|uniref:Transposase n=1 Tax=Cerrena zonata TaxID=2478898 RepID=A0AAW0FXW1_9APHY